MKKQSILLALTALALPLATPVAQAQVFITEFFYQSTSHGGSAEFIELTNTGGTPVDMNGWSYDDDARVPGAFDLSAFGVVAPGESVIISELSAEDFRIEWGLAESIKVIGNLGNPNGNNLGRNDEINIFDALDNLVDRLTYGDQDFPGSERFRYVTAVTDPSNYGQNNIYDWAFSVIGTDPYGVTTYTSIGGDIGSPGSAAIPEPSTYAAILGVLTLAGVALRRRIRTHRS